MSEINTAKTVLVYNTKAILGEGPVWDWRKQLLFWVDIEGKKLHQYNTLTKESSEWGFEEMIGAALPTEKGDIILALESGLASFDCTAETLTRHKVLENSDPKMRYNDAKVGPEGTIWIGSMHKEFVPHTGNLFRVTKDLKASIQIANTTISNGMAWSSDKKTFYYIDSTTHKVFAYDFEIGSDTISNKRILIEVPKDFGSPDGMCIDVEGMLWIAHWGDGCVRRWNPKTAKVLEKITVDAPHVTSCCFGGQDLDTLYITTARSGLSQEQQSKFPLSGGLFTYKPKVKGTPITYFKNL